MNPLVLVKRPGDAKRFVEDILRKTHLVFALDMRIWIIVSKLILHSERVSFDLVRHVRLASVGYAYDFTPTVEFMLNYSFRFYRIRREYLSCRKGMVENLYKGIRKSVFAWLPWNMQRMKMKETNLGAGNPLSSGYATARSQKLEGC